MIRMKKIFTAILCLMAIVQIAVAQKPRARTIGIPFDGTPGKFKSYALPHKLVMDILKKYNRVK